MTSSQIAEIKPGDILHVRTARGCAVVTIEYVEGVSDRRRYPTAWGRSGTVVQGISQHTIGAHLSSECHSRTWWPKWS